MGLQHCLSPGPHLTGHIGTQGAARGLVLHLVPWGQQQTTRAGSPAASAWALHSPASPPLPIRSVPVHLQQTGKVLSQQESVHPSRNGIPQTFVPGAQAFGSQPLSVLAPAVRGATAGAAVATSAPPISRSARERGHWLRKRAGELVKELAHRRTARSMTANPPAAAAERLRARAGIVRQPTVSTDRHAVLYIAPTTATRRLLLQQRSTADEVPRRVGGRLGLRRFPGSVRQGAEGERSPGWTRRRAPTGARAARAVSSSVGSVSLARNCAPLCVHWLAGCCVLCG